MAYNPINLGSVANDGTGDTLRTAGQKINAQFSEIYTDLDGNGFISVDQYGADPTGVSDSATAINNALAAAASEGAKVTFPGQYLCGSQIVVPEGVRVEGVARLGSRLIKGFNGTLLTYGSETSFADITFDGQRATYTGRLLQPNDDNGDTATFAGHRNLSFERVEFVDFDSYALELREVGSGIFNLVRFDGGNEYAIEETGGTIGDRSRYVHWNSCEVRNAKGAVHSKAGSRDSYYDIRVQLCSEHAYRIEAGQQDNIYRNLIAQNNGSAFYVVGQNSLARPTMQCRITENCVSPPAQYGGRDPAQIYFTSLTGQQDMVFIGGTVRASSATPNVSIDADSGYLMLTTMGTILQGAIKNTRLVTTTPSLVTADLTGALNCVGIEALSTENEGAYLKNLKTGVKLHVTNRAVIRSSDVTLLDYERFVRVSASSGVRTITLPAASSVAGRLFTVIKSDSSANAVNVTGTENINGSASVSLTTQFQAITVYSDGSAWWRTDL